MQNTTHNKQAKQSWNRRVSNEELKKMLSEVSIIENKYPEPATILPEPFCPKCGCSYSKAVFHEDVTYPDSYIEYFCSKCGFLVGIVDNSPFMHALEFKDQNYEIAL